MTKTVTRLAALSFVLFTTAFTPLAKADEWDKKTVITTHEPIQIQGKVLEPGQYVMKLLDSADRTPSFNWQRGSPKRPGSLFELIGTRDLLFAV